MTRSSSRAAVLVDTDVFSILYIDTRAKLDSAPTISIDSGVVDAYASLTAACRRVGHALHDKIHTGDRWIAACAISKEVPLLSLDGIYAGAPDLALLGG